MRAANPLTTIQMVEAIDKKWSLIEAISSAASYGFFTHSITVSRFTTDDLTRMLGGDLPLQRQILPVLAHEYVHYRDVVSTVWGQEYLGGLFKSIERRLDGNEHDYESVIEFYRSLSRLKYADFYTVESEEDHAYEPWDGKPWKYRLTSGMQYLPNGKLSDDRPISFMNFYTNDDLWLCRVPISIVSLLELSARAKEISVRIEAIYQEPDKEHRNALLDKLSQDSMADIYEVGLTLYSTAVHYIANTLHLTDVRLAYNVGSHLAQIALQLPDELFEQVRVPAELAERKDMYLQLRDRPFVFMCLAKNAASLRTPPMQHDADFGTWLDEVLLCSGLPDSSTLSTRVAETLSSQSVLHELSNEDVRLMYMALTSTGSSLISRHGIIDIVTADIHPNDGPIIIFKDNQTFIPEPLTKLGMDENFFHDWVEVAYNADRRIDELVKACR